MKKSFAILIILGVVACGCSSINRRMGLKDDNFVEEVVEKVIESELGVDVDLTPFSPE